MNQRSADDLQRLLAEEPFVRALAHQLAVEDAEEVAQQTWLQALQQRGGSIERPRAWLARIASRVAANLRRGDRRRQNRQRAVAKPDLVPSSAELLEREERRRALVAAVDELPPSLRTVVLLRWFEGLPPRRIAAETGVPVTMVWTQLHRALELLRRRLDAAHGGDRQAWLPPLVVFAAGRRGPPPLLAPALFAPAAWLIGAIAMTTKSKIVAAAAAVLALASAWILWPGEGPPAVWPADEPSAQPPAQARAEPPPEVSPEPAPAAEPQRAAVRTEPPGAATTGALVVHVRYGDDHAPAPDWMLTLLRPGTDPRVEGRRGRTDASGTARFEALPPGTLYVSNGSKLRERVEITAGQTTEIDCELAVGLTITGVVVDAADVPVAGALIEVTMMARADTYPEVVATTGADGRFTARASPTACMVGARAAGYTASPLRFLLGKDGNNADIKLVLGANGGSVDGLVVDAAGTPIPDAVVILGSGELSGIGGRDHAPPFPALARSDAEGRFHAAGIPAGEQPAQARAVGYAPWQGACAVAAGVTLPLRVTLGPGATIRGTVVDTEGRPVRAEVEVGSWDELAHYHTRSAADGSFELVGLPAGDIDVRAAHDDLGKGTRRVHTEAGATSGCALQLSRGLELVGRVIDEDGAPVSSVMIECLADRGMDWFAFVPTDAQGRFSAANCPEDRTVNVTVRARGIEELHRNGIDPKAGEVVLQVKRALLGTARIVGTVVGPDGRPVANASVHANRQGASDSTGIQATDDAGRFELPELVPGAWRVMVRSTQHPEFHSEVGALAADSTWDLGTIALPLGGTAVVRRSGGDTSFGPTFRIVDAAGARTWSLQQVGGLLRTRVLSPGDYHLLVSGQGIAAQAVPFAIRPGAETAVDVQLGAGIAQRFEVVPPPDATGVDRVSLRVRRGNDLVGWVWMAVRPAEPPATMWLLPGDYALTASAGDRRGAATFTVGQTSGAPVRVELR